MGPTPCSGDTARPYKRGTTSGGRWSGAQYSVEVCGPLARPGSAQRASPDERLGDKAGAGEARDGHDDNEDDVHSAKVEEYSEQDDACHQGELRRTARVTVSREARSGASPDNAIARTSNACPVESVTVSGRGDSRPERGGVPWREPTVPATPR